MKKPSYDKLIKLISAITFWAGLALCAYSVISLLLERTSAPAGTCPIPGARPFMIAAAVLLVVSFVTSFFYRKDSKKGNKD